MTEQVVDFEGKPIAITFLKGLPPSAAEVYLFIFDDGSVHEGVIINNSTAFPQGAVSTTNAIGGFHEKLEIPLRRVAGYASCGPQYTSRERPIWLAADFVDKD